MSIERLYLDHSWIHFVDSQLLGLGQVEILISRSMLSGHGHFEGCTQVLIESSFLQNAHLSFANEIEDTSVKTNEQSQINLIWSSCRQSSISIYDPSLILSIEDCIFHRLDPKSQQSETALLIEPI